MENKILKSRFNKNFEKFSRKSKKVFLIGMCASLILPFSYESKEVLAATNQITVSFPENPSRTQTKTITLPSNFDSVSSISVNTGEVSYNVNGNQMAITVSDGDYSSRESFTNTQIDKIDAFTVVHSSTNSFPTTDSYSDGNGYTGTLNADGSPYLVSGSVIPGSSKTVTEKDQSTNPNLFPATFPYDKYGFKGTLTRNGTPIKSVSNGLYYPPEYKTGTGSRVSGTNSFPTTIPYDDGTFSGTLNKDGASISRVVSGVYTPSDTKSVSQTKQNSTIGDKNFPTSISYNSGGYSGTLSKDGSPTSYSGSYTAAHTYTDYGRRSTNTCEGAPSGYTRTSCTTYASHIMQSGDSYWDLSIYYYGTHTYYKDIMDVNDQYPDRYAVPVGASIRIPFKSGMRATTNFEWKATFSKPASDTRKWQQKYTGNVTKPASDTRVYEYTQNYSGTVVKPERDTREYIYTQYYTGSVSSTSQDTRKWAQNYSGFAYKSGTDYRNYKYTYNVVINYNIASATPSTSCSYRGISPGSTIISNYLPKCVTLDTGSTNLYSFKYNFSVTGISNTGKSF